jgi:uncharacterized membrane protein
MLFFALIAIVTLSVRLASRLGIPRLADWRACMRCGLSVALVFTGLDHLVTPERYLPMMPGFVPFHAEVVFATGLCELAGAVGLLVPKLRRLTGIMLAAYFICVFPANIKNAVEGLTIDGLPGASWYYWVRLLFQPLVVWWTLYASGQTDWPIRQSARATTRPATPLVSRSAPSAAGKP